MTKLYCTAPFNSLTIREDGIVRTCCPGETVLGNIREQDIESIINGKELHDIKQDILNSKIPDNCRSCQEAERNKMDSVRGMYNTNYPIVDNTLQFLDIRWNNLCNLACSYCNEFASTAWYKIVHPNDKLLLTNKFDNDLLEWIKTQDNLHTLMLVGGEPLLMKQNVRLLNDINSEKIKTISIITNLSTDIKKNPISKILIERFKQETLWHVSIENYGKQYEYVRAGANIDQVESNITYLVENVPNINLHFIYSIYTGFSFLDIIQHFYKLGITRYNLSMILNNPILDLFNYPRQVLEIARDQAIQTQNWATTHNVELVNIDLILNKLNYHIDNDDNITSFTKLEFVDKHKEYDKTRPGKFKDLWSYEYNLILDSLQEITKGVTVIRKC